MGAIKITAADKWFSQCIRHRADWSCERCGQHYPEGPGRKGLHCSHVVGRGSWATRHDAYNAFSLCYGCHNYLGSHPNQHIDWVLSQIGDGLYGIVKDRAQDTTLGRANKRDQKAISKHYRDELRRMEREGTRDLVSW